MKILNSNSMITGAIPAVIEEKDSYIINGCYYDKETLSPVPFEVLPLLNASIYEPFMERALLVDQAFGSGSDTPGGSGYTLWKQHERYLAIIPDEYDNRYYFSIIEGSYINGSSRTYIYKIEEKDGNINILATANFLNLNLQYRQYIDQDEDYLYILTDLGNTVKVLKISKTTLEITDLCGTDASYNTGLDVVNPIVVYKDPQYIFLFYMVTTNTNVNSSMEFIRVSRVSKNVSFLRRAFIDRSDTGSNGSLDTRAVINYEDGSIGLLYPIFKNRTTSAFNEIKLYPDKFAEGAEQAITNTAWTVNNFTTPNGFKYDKTVLNDKGCTFRTQFFEHNDKKYMLFMVYDISYNNNTSSTSRVPYQGIYTFEVTDEENKEMTFIAYNQISSTASLGSILFDPTGMYGFCGLRSNIQMIKFDEEAESFVNVGNIIPDVYSVGMDSLRRVWYIAKDKSVSMTNFEDPQIVDIQFEEDHYVYSGNNINTHITFSATNYIEAPFTGRFKLTMSGSAVFDQTNSQEITFNYTGEPVIINITINGVKPVVISPTFIAESE